MFRKIDLSQISGKDLVINVYITQGLILVIAILCLAFISDIPVLLALYSLFWSDQPFWNIGLGCIAACIVITLQLVLYRYLPKRFFDDGGLNEKLFRYLHPVHIMIVCFVVSTCEELLFRGVIQNQLGVILASIIFTLIHFRYLHQWLVTAFLFLISLGLGWLYIISGSLIAPIAAHFLIDTILGIIIHYNWLNTDQDIGESSN